ncbi:hypothetical protein DM860_007131 [Cuscuta australis]|uniref:Bidirectional sugar transporter SWEET n=1 Tax=Cuscuta australis TaxID=267555 RepID=A0A328EA27_9ASTE|nr:hypothetical protein DM860_007131 [Cuscuta australis]
MLYFNKFDFSPTIVKIWKEGTVAQYSSVPYLATFINCGLWSLYAIPIVHPKALLVLTIDGAGLAIEVVFLFVFFFCSDKRKRFALALVILAELIFMAVLAALVITLAHSWRLRSAIIGTIAAMASIAMYASPLASMKLVISSKSVEYMPFSLSLCSLLNSLCWTLYALVGIDLCILAMEGRHWVSDLAAAGLDSKPRPTPPRSGLDVIDICTPTSTASKF